jgi:PAS domain S-box-containing protein
VSALHDPANASFLLEHVRDVLFVVDADTGEIVDANAAAVTLYGYPREELVGKTIFELRAIDPDVARRQMVEANAAGGLLFEAVHVRRDGSQFPVEVSTRGITLDDRRRLLSVVRDISERKRLEAERAALAETTQRALDARDEFLVIASHELRAPVTNVDLQLKQLQRRFARDDGAPELARSVEQALAEVERLSLLISTLLDAQRMRGKIVLARGRLDLGALLHDLASRMRAKTPAIDLHVDAGAIWGTWDRMRLEQIFTNLVANAHKYGQQRPIHVTAAVEGDGVHVDVRDQGIGIRSEDIGRVFGKFERAVPQAYGGFGLGLYITRQLVEAHGGHISVESAPGVGTTFRVTLPLT